MLWIYFKSSCIKSHFHRAFRDLQTRHARAVHFFHPQFTRADRQRVAGFRKAAEFLRHPAARRRDAFVMFDRADDFFQFVQRQRAGDFPDIFADARQFGLFRIKLILNQIGRASCRERV